MPHSAAVQLFDEGLERRVGAVDRDHAGAMVLFIPGFMQRGDAWRPVAELLPERYPSTMLDHSEHSFEGRLREIGTPAPRRRARGLLARRAARAAGGAALTRVLQRAWSSWVRRPASTRVRCACSAPRPTRSSPPGWRRCRSRTSWRCWERQPLFADQSDALVEEQRPGRLSHDPRSLALLLRTAGQGVLEPVWHELRARATAAGDRRRARRRLHARGEAHRRRRPERPVAIVEEAGHAAQLQQPDEVARLISEFLDAALRRCIVGEILVVDGHPEARGPVGTASVPARGRRQRARDAGVEQPERRQPAGERELLGGRELKRRGDAPRPVEGARQERAEPVSSGPRGAARAQARSRRRWPASRSRRRTPPARPPGAASRSEATDSSAAIGGDTRWRTSASSRSVRHGCSTSSRSFPSMLGSPATASSTDQAPLASTRRAGHGPIASRTAATRSASSGSPTFSLKQA